MWLALVLCLAAGDSDETEESVLDQPAQWTLPIRMPIEEPPDMRVKIGKYVAITPGLILQARYTVNRREIVLRENNTTVGFAIARARIALGAEITQYLGMFIRAGANPGGAFGIERGYADLKFGKTGHLRGGQFYLPPFAEENAAANMTLAADYSPTGDTFEPGASQGGMLELRPGPFRISAAFTDGLRTGFSEVQSAVTADYAFTGYIEAKAIEEDWARFDDFTSWRGQDLALKLGMGAHVQSGGRTGSTLDLDILYLTEDLQLEGNGWNLFGQFVWAQETPGPAFGLPNGTAYRDYGALIQGGVMTWRKLELFSRYDMVIADGAPRPVELGGPGTQRLFRTFTGGVNFYLLQHVAKFTTDFQYMFDPTANSIVPTSSNRGILPTTDGDQWALRVQWTISL